VLHSVQKDHSNIISHINSKQHSSAVKMGTVLNKEIQGILNASENKYDLRID